MLRSFRLCMWVCVHAYLAWHSLSVFGQWPAINYQSLFAQALLLPILSFLDFRDMHIWPFDILSWLPNAPLRGFIFSSLCVRLGNFY